MRITVLNGPNLNLLGSREPGIYGEQTLSALEAAMRERAASVEVELCWHQTNHEGEFVDLVQALDGQAEGAIVNAAALTHTSWAVRDAMLAVNTPFVEVHLSNVFAREPERRRSLLADLAIGVIAGFGGLGYLMALDAMAAHLRRSEH